MISARWHVTLIGVAALLAGCFSTEKKKDIKKNGTTQGNNIAIRKQTTQSNLNDNTLNGPLPSIHSINDNAISPQDNTAASRVIHRTPFGTTVVNFPMKNNALSSASFDLLLPLINRDERMLFSQYGIRRHNGRSILNLGMGQRHFFESWMLGYNAFYDAQISGNHHQRTGIGFELWGNNLKLAANGYYRLSDWKTSSSLSGTKERAANGFDLVAETFLPAYPQLGAKVKYERYFGNEVATLSHNERHQNPSALTAGLTYSPVPLITLGVDHSRWNNGKNESKGNISLNYHFNVPLAKQLDPNTIPLRRNLAGSRFDVVARNNNIVLEYQRKEQIHFQLPMELSGVEGERKYINFKVSAKNDIARIQWDDSSLRPGGGKVVARNNNAYQVQFPAFSSHGANRYVISAVAYDRLGNASNRSEMNIFAEYYHPIQNQISAPHDKTAAPVAIHHVKPLIPPDVPQEDAPATDAGVSSVTAKIEEIENIAEGNIPEATPSIIDIPDAEDPFQSQPLQPLVESYSGEPPNASDINPPLISNNDKDVKNNELSIPEKSEETHDYFPKMFDSITIDKDTPSPQSAELKDEFDSVNSTGIPESQNFTDSENISKLDGGPENMDGDPTLPAQHIISPMVVGAEMSEQPDKINPKSDVTSSSQEPNNVVHDPLNDVIKKFYDESIKFEEYGSFKAYKDAQEKGDSTSPQLQSQSSSTATVLAEEVNESSSLTASGDEYIPFTDSSDYVSSGDEESINDRFSYDADAEQSDTGQLPLGEVSRDYIYRSTSTTSI